MEAGRCSAWRELQSTTEQLLSLAQEQVECWECAKRTSRQWGELMTCSCACCLLKLLTSGQNNLTKPALNDPAYTAHAAASLSRMADRWTDWQTSWTAVRIGGIECIQYSLNILFLGLLTSRNKTTHDLPTCVVNQLIWYCTVAAYNVPWI